MARSMHVRLVELWATSCLPLLLLLACSLATCRGAPEEDLVTKLPGQPDVHFKQYSGYVTVDADKGRALFYYFVEAERDSPDTPLILWLNGGPGCSSVAGGAFTELGPFFPNGFGDGLVRNSHSWNKVANLLFLESPAGVGWSYSNTTADYFSATDESTARDNLMFLLNWFEKFPEYRSREFFLTGESYAGHYIPQLAALVVDYNKSPSQGFSFNLHGVAIGNPLIRLNVDAAAVYTFLWSHGIISEKTYRGIVRTCDFMTYELTGEISETCNGYISATYSEEGPFINGYDIFLDVCLPGVAQQELRLKEKITRRSLGVDVCIVVEMETYLNKPEVQKALHANTTRLNHSYTQCSSYEILHYSRSNYSIDILPVLSGLLQHGFRILVYSGDADQVVPFIGTRQNFDDLSKSLKLKTKVNYTAWYHGKQVAGWTKTNGNLTFATVRAAAHMVPYSQPARALALFTSFINGKPLTFQNGRAFCRLDSLEDGASTITSKIRKLLPYYLTDLISKPWTSAPPSQNKMGSLDCRGPNSPINSLSSFRIRIGAEVPEIDRFELGENASMEELQGSKDGFLTEQLAKYEFRNDPAKTSSLSNISFYLHYGEIGPQQIALEALKSFEQSPKVLLSCVLR